MGSRDTPRAGVVVFMYTQEIPNFKPTPCSATTMDAMDRANPTFPLTIFLYVSGARAVILLELGEGTSITLVKTKFALV